METYDTIMKNDPKNCSRCANSHLCLHTSFTYIVNQKSLPLYTYSKRRVNLRPENLRPIEPF